MQPVDVVPFDGREFVTGDRWRYLAEGEELPPGGNVILTAAQAEGVDPRHFGPLGRIVDPAAALASLGDPNRYALLVLPFPKFSDGRSYSQGHRLRAMGFRGELRATGDVLFDQLQLMHRCGFDTFEIGDPVTRALLESGRRPDLARFYQPGYGAEMPVGTRPWARRPA